MRWTFLLLAILTLAVAEPAVAAVPATVTLDGRLLTAAGGPVSDGDYTLTFALYAAADATATVWSEQVPKVAVKGGAFSHELGSGKPLGQGVLAAPQGLWLGVTVGSEPELPRTPLRSVLYARRAELAEGLQCAGCVDATMLGPQVLAGYAKTQDLSGYVKVSELGDYVKASALAKVAGTGQYGDLAGLPVLVKVGAVCGTGLVVKGIKADGGLECGAAAVGGKCGVGEVVVEVKADGGVVCGKAAVVGGKCEPGKVVTEVKADGGVVCGENWIKTDASGVATAMAGKALIPTVPTFKRLWVENGNVCGISAGSSSNICWKPLVAANGFPSTGSSRKGPNLDYLGGFAIDTSGDIPPIQGYVAGMPAFLAGYKSYGFKEFFHGTPLTSIICASNLSGQWRCFGSYYDFSCVEGCNYPVNLQLTGLLPWTSLSVGQNQVCGIGSDGAVGCLGSTGGPAPWVQVPAAKFSTIAASDLGFCGVATDGQIFCWGMHPTNKTDGTELKPPVGSNFIQVVHGRYIICGLDKAGAIKCANGSDTKELKVPPDPLKVFSLRVYWTGTPSANVCGLRATDGEVVCGGSFYAIPPGPMVELVNNGEAYCARNNAGVVSCFSENSFSWPPPSPP